MCLSTPPIARGSADGSTLANRRGQRDPQQSPTEAGEYAGGSFANRTQQTELHGGSPSVHTFRSRDFTTDDFSAEERQVTDPLRTGLGPWVGEPWKDL